MGNTTTTTTEARALTLLGTGLGPEVVASALGVDVSRISQLLSDTEFKSKVTALRFESLQKHNVRDDKYDTIETALIDKFEQSIPLMYKPQDLLRAITVINGAKRRGASAPEQIVNQSTVVNLVMPTQIIQQFTINRHNQVVSAGDQELLTIQSGTLLRQTEQRLGERDGPEQVAITSGETSPELARHLAERAIRIEETSTHES